MYWDCTRGGSNLHIHYFCKMHFWFFKIFYGIPVLERRNNMEVVRKIYCVLVFVALISFVSVVAVA